MKGKRNFIKFNKQYDEVGEDFIHELEVELNSISKGKLPDNWSWVESSENTVVARRFQDKNIGGIYFKKFLKRSFLENFKTVFRGSRCERSIQQAEVLLGEGFNTPELVCWGKNNSCEFMVTREVLGIGYGDYINKELKADPCDRQNRNNLEKIKRKRNIVSDIGVLVGRLHKAGIIHGDLRPNNVLIALDGVKKEFYLIDNERNKIHKNRRDKLVIKNLVQIMMFFPEDLAMSYRFRFYKEYFSVVGEKNKEEQKRIMKAVHNIVSRRLEGRSRNHAEL